MNERQYPQEPLIKTELMKFFTQSPRAKDRVAIGSFVAFNQSAISFEVFLGKQKDEHYSPDMRITFKFSNAEEAYDFAKDLRRIAKADWLDGEKIVIESEVKDPITGEMSSGPSLAAGVSNTGVAYMAIHEHDKPTCMFKLYDKRKNKYTRKDGTVKDEKNASREAADTIGELLMRKIGPLVKTTTIDTTPRQPVRNFSAGVADDNFI